MAAKKALLSNETKIGILAIISIAILIWGYTYLKGRNLLTTSNLLYVEYPNVDMLANSAPVVINGFQVGVVANMYLKPEDMRTIVTVLDIDNDVKVPKDAVAQIVSLDITGSKGVRLVFNRPCNGEDCAKSGDYLKGEVKSLLASMLSQDELKSYLDGVAPALGEVVDTLNSKLTDPNAEGIAEVFRSLNGTTTHLEALTARFNTLMARSSGDIEKTLSSLASITSKIDESNDQIKVLLDNAAAFSEQLKNMELDETMATVKGTMATADTTFVELEKTLKTAKKALSGVSEIIDGLNQGEGTLGKLISDDSLYYQLSNASQQLEVFLEDLEEKPYRYIPLKSRNKIKRYDRKDEKEEDEENED